MILLVGFTKPIRCRVKDVRLPEIILPWSTSDIPDEITEELRDSIQIVYNGSMESRDDSRLRRLFGNKVQKVKDVVSLEAKISQQSVSLGKQVGDYFTPAVEFIVTNVKVNRMLGERRVPSGTCAIRPSFYK